MKKSIHSRHGLAGTEYDAVVVGSGPNGLAAAITLQKAGCSVMLLEAKSRVGGGLCSEELTLPGFIHDVSSAIHPLAVQSPFFLSLPLGEHGLKYVYPEISLAHPFQDGSAIGLYNSVEKTAAGLGIDESAYKKLIYPVVENWEKIRSNILAPISIAHNTMAMTKFGLRAIKSADQTAKIFKTEKGKAFWSGLSVHSQLPFSFLSSSAIGIVLLAAAHNRGWPLAEGGSQTVADALASYFKSLGGKIETNTRIENLSQLPASRAILLDLTPRQILSISGDSFSNFFRGKLEKFRYGMGVFKIDWALDNPPPFTSEIARKAATLHLGGTYTDSMIAESKAWSGKEDENPTVLFAQQTIVDPSRAPMGKHTAWAYCHVPSGSEKDMTAIIEKRVDLFAPGFRDSILGRHTMTTTQLESYNANNAGGDIGGGANTIEQILFRPVIGYPPYRTSAKNIFICSSSTPPGGGIHGMCGYHAAKKVLRKIFGVS